MHLDLKSIEKKVEGNPAVKESLKLIKADNIYTLMSRHVLSEKLAKMLFRDYESLNLDRFPVIEFAIGPFVAPGLLIVALPL